MIDEGKIVKIRGNVTEFRNALQVTVERIRLADDRDPVDLSALVPAAPIDVEESFGEVRALLESIADTDYRKAALELLKRHEQAFRQSPAAKSVHHGFLR